MKIFAAILSTFIVQFTSLTSAQEFSFGRCGPFPTVKNFDPQRVSDFFSIFFSILISVFLVFRNVVRILQLLCLFPTFWQMRHGKLQGFT